MNPTVGGAPKEPMQRSVDLSDSPRVPTHHEQGETPPSLVRHDWPETGTQSLAETFNVLGLGNAVVAALVVDDDQSARIGRREASKLADRDVRSSGTPISQTCVRINKNIGLVRYALQRCLEVAPSRSRPSPEHGSRQDSLGAIKAEELRVGREVLVLPLVGDHRDGEKVP